MIRQWILCRLLHIHSWRYIPAREKRMPTPYYDEWVFQRLCRRCTKRQWAREVFNPYWITEEIKKQWNL